MTDPTDKTISRTEQIASLLHQAGETHHVVYSDTDGEDPDWATFYSDWLLSHGRIGDLLGSAPVRSQLTAELVALDERYRKTRDQDTWERYYARDLVARFAA